MPDPILQEEDNLGELPSAFTFQDVRTLAAKILKRANIVAQDRINAAQKQVADMEKSGFQKGQKEGLEAGRQQGLKEGTKQGANAAREEFVQRTNAVVPLLEELLAHLHENRVALQAQAEADMLRLAIAVARRIVRREVTVDPEAILPVVREAIGLCTERNDIMLRVNPADAEVIEAELPGLHAAFTDLERVRIEVDDSIDRGGLHLFGRETEVDMRLEEQFAALERALVGEKEMTEASAEALDFAPPVEKSLSSRTPSSDQPPTDPEPSATESETTSEPQDDSASPPPETPA